MQSFYHNVTILYRQYYIDKTRLAELAVKDELYNKKPIKNILKY